MIKSYTIRLYLKKWQIIVHKIFDFNFPSYSKQKMNAKTLHDNFKNISCQSLAKTDAYEQLLLQNSHRSRLQEFRIRNTHSGCACNAVRTREMHSKIAKRVITCVESLRYAA